MLLNDIQNVVQIFANLAVASAMGLCLVLGTAGTLKYRFDYDCQTCRIETARRAAVPIAMPAGNHIPMARPVTVAMSVR